jgi:hypothetical protein
MFGSEWSLKFLSLCTQVHADGTFNTRPLLFAQIYIIFGFDNGYMVPCIYCLTTKFDKILYKKIFNHIITLCANINLTFSPQRFTSDFELAAIQACKSTFRNVKISACFFHYSQSIWRKVQELGLSRLVSSSRRELDNDEHKKADNWIQGAIGLALIPPTLVETTWVQLMDEYTPNEHRTATEFNDYLVSTYVQDGSARFDVDIWNVYEAILNRRPRTNNHVEGYNRRMKAEFPIHPHIYQFIDVLRNEHEYQHHLAEESQVHLRSRKKIHDEIDAKLAMLHEEHKNKQISDVQLAIRCGRAIKTRPFKK